MANKYDKAILITGGCGFIGSHVVRHFVNNYPNYLIINFDALTYAGNLENLRDVEGKKNYLFIRGNICSQSDVENVMMQNVTDIIHLAAESHVDRSMVNPTNFVDTNIIGTINLLEMAKKFWKDGEHRFINMGTDEIYGSLGVDDEPFNENTPLDPHSPYSTSKTAAVMFGKTYYEAYGLPVINISCGNAIGPNQFPEKLVPLTIDRIINREKIPIYGKGEQMRDWTNVHDIVNAFDVIFHKGRIGEMYCIGGDACTKNIHMVKAICYAYAHQTGEGDWMDKDAFAEDLFEELVEFIPDPRGKSHDFRYDIDHAKITNELGWEPKYTFEQSVAGTVKWYLDSQDWVRNVKNGEYKKWINDYYGKETDKK